MASLESGLRALALWTNETWRGVESTWSAVRIWYARLPEYFFGYVLVISFSVLFYFGILTSLVNAYVYTFGPPARLGSLLAYSALTSVMMLYCIKNLAFDEDWGEYSETASRRQDVFMSMMVYFVITAIISAVAVIVCIARLLP